MTRSARAISGQLAPHAADRRRSRARQHGVVARWQLVQAGLAEPVIDNLVDTRKLISLHRGIYAAGYRPVGPRSREMAVVLLAGRRGALAGESSAGLWCMTRPWRGPVHALSAHSWKGDGFVIHRTRHLPPADVARHWGIPVTTPLRTLLDLSRILPLDALDAALAEALVRKLLTLEALEPRAKGKLKQLLTTAAPTKSKLERDLRRILRAYRPAATDQQRLRLRLRWRLHWPGHRLVAELDGWLFHGHGTLETDRERDPCSPPGWPRRAPTAARPNDTRPTPAFAACCPYQRC